METQRRWSIQFHRQSEARPAQRGSISAGFKQCLDFREDLFARALHGERARRIASVEALGAMMLDLLPPMRGRRAFVAALVSRWAIRIGWRGHGAMLCIRFIQAAGMIPVVTKRKCDGCTLLKHCASRLSNESLTKR